MFIKDPQHKQVILKGKSYGKEIQMVLPSEYPRIHPERIQIKRGRLIKRLDLLVQNYKNSNTTIGLNMYTENYPSITKNA